MRITLYDLWIGDFRSDPESWARVHPPIFVLNFYPRDRDR